LKFFLVHRVLFTARAVNCALASYSLRYFGEKCAVFTVWAVKIGILVGVGGVARVKLRGFTVITVKTGYWSATERGKTQTKRHRAVREVPETGRKTGK
jgi:hypothetical protein